MKGAITLVLALALALIAMPLVAADSYQLYCLSSGQVLDLPALCNPEMDKRTGPINICMHILDNGKICPVTINVCNNLALSCSFNGGNTTVDQDPPHMDINSPVEGEIYGDRSILVDIDPDESASLYYMDNDEERLGWKQLCSRCSSYSRERSFKEGRNDLTFKAVDESGNEATFDVVFYIDSIDPKISKTAPTKGFAGGIFNVSFQESSPSGLVLNYGNIETGMRSRTVDIENDCTQNVDKYACMVEVDLSNFDEETIEYSFVLEDIGGNSIESKIILLPVDYSDPRINSLDYTIEGKSVTFMIDVTEQNLDKITYIDTTDPKAKEKTLCSGSQGILCEKKVSFKDGDHTVAIRARDKAGNMAEQTVVFFTDSTKPKIKKMLPTGGFASGDFYVEFEEQNAVSLILHYGNGADDRNSNIDLNGCADLGSGKHTCTADVDLTDYDGESIQYWFEINDRVNNTVLSKSIKLMVDITNPAITEITHVENGETSQVTLSITEINFDEATYMNNDDLTPKERSFCSSLKAGKCTKKLALNTGENHLTFYVYDDAGNAFAQNLEITV